MSVKTWNPEIDVKTVRTPSLPRWDPSSPPAGAPLSCRVLVCPESGWQFSGVTFAPTVGVGHPRHDPTLWPATPKRHPASRINELLHSAAGGPQGGRVHDLTVEGKAVKVWIQNHPLPTSAETIGGIEELLKRFGAGDFGVYGKAQDAKPVSADQVGYIPILGRDRRNVAALAGKVVGSVAGRYQTRDGWKLHEALTNRPPELREVKPSRSIEVWSFPDRPELPMVVCFSERAGEAGFW